MEGEGPGEGPLDQPGGPSLPVGDAFNPYAPTENYKQEQLNANLRRGGRGCMIPWILLASMPLAAILALTGR